MIFSLPNPIPMTVRDPEDMVEFFTKYGIVPYYGTEERTSHSFLDLLTTVTSLSPTFGAVMRDLKEFTFGLNLEIVGRAIPGLAMETTELDPSEQMRYAQYLSGLNITLPTIRKLSKRIDQHLNVCGNAYLRIKRVTVGETVRYYFEVPHYKHVAYLKSKDPGSRFLVISKFLGDETLMAEYPPAVLPATMAGDTLVWTSTERNMDEAIIHVKLDSDEDESDYYARPDILEVMTWLYVDFQLGNLNSKIAATDLISKKIIAFQAPDPNTIPYEDEDLEEINANGVIGGKKLDQFQANMLQLKQLITNLAGHPSTMGPGQVAGAIAGIEYPFSGQAPTTIDLEINRDTAYHTWQNDTAAAKICSTMGWAPELTALRQAKSTLGGNLLYDMFTIKNESTIKPRKIFFQDLWNGILAQVAGTGSGFENYGIEFPDVISSMVESLSVAKAESNNNNPATQVNQIRENEDDAANA